MYQTWAHCHILYIYTALIILYLSNQKTPLLNTSRGSTQMAVAPSGQKKCVSQGTSWHFNLWQFKQDLGRFQVGSKKVRTGFTFAADGICVSVSPYTWNRLVVGGIGLGIMRRSVKWFELSWTLTRHRVTPKSHYNVTRKKTTVICTNLSINPGSHTPPHQLEATMLLNQHDQRSGGK